MTNDINKDTIFQSLTNEDLIKVFDSLCGFSTGLTFISSVSPERILYSHVHLPGHLTSLINPTKNDTLYTIFKRVSGIDKGDYDWLIRQIIPNQEIENKRYTFTIELPWKLFGEGKTWVAYKCTPIELRIDERMQQFIVGEFGMASGSLVNKLQRIEIDTGTTRYKYWGDSEWYSSDILKLSSIEKTVITLSNTGLTLENIAKQTNKSEDTIKSIRKRIINKLNVDNMMQAIAITAG